MGESVNDKTAASTNQMDRFETEILTQDKNLQYLMNLPGLWIDKVYQRKCIKEIILDMDSSDSHCSG